MQTTCQTAIFNSSISLPWPGVTSILRNPLVPAQRTASDLRGPPQLEVRVGLLRAEDLCSDISEKPLRLGLQGSKLDMVSTRSNYSTPLVDEILAARLDNDRELPRSSSESCTP